MFWGYLLIIWALWGKVSMFSKLPDVKIKTATTKKEFDQLYRFRYQIYINELDRKQSHVDHNQQCLKEPLDKQAIHLIALSEDQIVGAARVNLNKLECLEPYSSFYGIKGFDQKMNNSAIVTKFMVSKKFRHSTLSISLAMACYKVGIQNKVKYTFIDCYPHLVDYFHKLGFKSYKKDIIHPEFGKVSPMVLYNQDLRYLKSIKSPFYNMIEQPSNSILFSNK